MISVSIFVNNNPIFTRSARNLNKHNSKGETAYLVDTGKTIYHKREEGAIELAIRLLKTIDKRI